MLFALLPGVALAQGSVARAADSTASRELGRADPVSPASDLAGRVRVVLDGSVVRRDRAFGGGPVTTSRLSGGAALFAGEHVQLGIAPSYSRLDWPHQQSVQTSSTALVANYVFGAGSRWRGYVGGYGSFATWTHVPNTAMAGVQGGALRFLDPAVAVRGELRYRKSVAPTTGPYSGGPGYLVAIITLDPYVGGAASGVVPTAAGWGTVDVAGEIYHERYGGMHDVGFDATVAPYLTRWLQVGVNAVVDHTSAFGGVTWHQLRGFGRGYVPLSVRTQPFIEGFAESSTLNGYAGGLSDYGGALGVRQMLNGRVALDVGVRRTVQPPDTHEVAGHRFTVHWPGSTGLYVGVVTRLGRAR